MKKTLSLLLFSLFAIQTYSQKLPEYNHTKAWVQDFSKLFSESEKTALYTKLDAYEKRTGNEIVVATIDDLQGYEISDYTNKLYKHWLIGKKDKDNGVLILISAPNRKWRIEVAYGLEGYLTDYQAKRIGERDFKPNFKIKDYYAGVDLAISDIIESIDAEAAKDAPPITAPEKKEDNNQQNGEIGNTFLIIGFGAIALFILFVTGTYINNTREENKRRKIREKEIEEEKAKQAELDKIALEKKRKITKERCLVVFNAFKLLKGLEIKNLPKNEPHTKRTKEYREYLATTDVMDDLKLDNVNDLFVLEKSLARLEEVTNEIKKYREELREFEDYSIGLKFRLEIEEIRFKNVSVLGANSKKNFDSLLEKYPKDFGSYAGYAKYLADNTKKFTDILNKLKEEQVKLFASSELTSDIVNNIEGDIKVLSNIVWQIEHNLDTVTRDASKITEAELSIKRLPLVQLSELKERSKNAVERKNVSQYAKNLHNDITRKLNGLDYSNFLSILVFSQLLNSIENDYNSTISRANQDIRDYDRKVAEELAALRRKQQEEEQEEENERRRQRESISSSPTWSSRNDDDDDRSSSSRNDDDNSVSFGGSGDSGGGGADGDW